MRQWMYLAGDGTLMNRTVTKLGLTLAEVSERFVRRLRPLRGGNPDATGRVPARDGVAGHLAALSTPVISSGNATWQPTTPSM